MNFRALIGLLLCLTLATPLRAQMSPELETLRTEWARIKYQLPKAERKEAFEQLSERAAKLTTAHPGEAEPLIWEGITISFPNYTTLFLGITFLLIVYAIPHGFVGLVEDWTKRLKR